MGKKDKKGKAAPAPAPAPKKEPAPAPAPSKKKEPARAPAPKSSRRGGGGGGSSSRDTGGGGSLADKAKDEEAKRKKDEERKKEWADSHGSGSGGGGGGSSGGGGGGGDGGGSGRDHSVSETLRNLNADAGSVRRPDDDARERAARRRELEDMRSFALMQLCKEKGLDDSGGKPDMIRRVLDFEAAVADGIIAAPGDGENLTAMNFSELSQLARDEGVDRDRIDECQDAQMPRAELTAVLQEHRRSQSRGGRGGGGRPAGLSDSHGYSPRGDGYGSGRAGPRDDFDGSLSTPTPDRVSASITLATDDFEGTVGSKGSAERNRFEFDFREEMARKMGVDPSRIKVTAVMTEEQALAEEERESGGG